nr:Muramidase (phage lambda lysozyme) (COG4678) [uncultured Mediterranean phage uvMED]
MATQQNIGGRIYKSEAPKVSYEGSAKSGQFNPLQASSKKKEQQQKKSALSLDISTKAKQLQREQQADTLALGAEQQAQKGLLSLQQTAEQAELSMDQMYEKNTLEQNQLNEQLNMGLEMSELKAKGQMQQARVKFAGTVIQGLLDFGKVYADLETEREANQKILDSGAWAFTNDYQVEYGGKAIVQREQQQLQAEVADELSIVQAAPGDVVTQEQLRGELGVDLTTQRFTNQLEVGEAAANIGFDLTRAYNDPNFKITMPDGRKISAFEARNLQEFRYVVNALAQAVTAQYGLKAYADDVAAVQQYVPKLEAARNQLFSSEGKKFISALENNRETTGYQKTAQYLANTGDVAGAWAQFYHAAAYSGKYDGDQAKITKAAVEAFVEYASDGQLRALRNERVFEGGPTFAKDRRYNNLIDDAIIKRNNRTHNLHNSFENAAKAQVGQATNQFTADLIDAGTDQTKIEAAHLKYETTLKQLADSGSIKARTELLTQLYAPNNYSPINFHQLRERIANGDLPTEVEAQQMLRENRINVTEFNALKKLGFATAEDFAKHFGGQEAKKAADGNVNFVVATALKEELAGVDVEFTNQKIAPIVDDILKRRDNYLRTLLESNGGSMDPSEFLQMGENWLAKNVPLLVKNVTFDDDTGIIKGYRRTGLSSADITEFQVGNAENGFKGLTPFTNPYTAKDSVRLDNLSTVQLSTYKRYHTVNFQSDKILTTKERDDAIKAYLLPDGIYPSTVTAKALALGVRTDDLVKMQANAAGFKLGPRPQPETPAFDSEASARTFSQASSPVERRALDIIGKYEADGVGGYNAVNQGGADGGRRVLGYSGDIRQMQQHQGKELTSMTVGEIMALQSEDGSDIDSWIARGKLHAVGRYQFIGSTFANLVKQLGIKPEQRFTPALQDAMALHLLRTAENGLHQWIGPSDNATQQERVFINQARDMNRILRRPQASAAQVRRVKMQNIASAYDTAYPGVWTP